MSICITHYNCRLVILIKKCYVKYIRNIVKAACHCHKIWVAPHGFSDNQSFHQATEANLGCLEFQVQQHAIVN